MFSPGNPSTLAYELSSQARFVYDGWNLLAVLDTNNAPQLSFTWGTDLSGTLQGAGGVGGLLAIRVHSGENAGTYLFTYDGNGNIVALVNASDSSVAARYEYGPFGEIIRATGSMAKANPFRFSTKYTDDETDWVYFGYRYYNSSAGGWPSRDPLEEDGGLNHYGFLNNNAMSDVDVLGTAGLDANQGFDFWMEFAADGQAQVRQGGVWNWFAGNGGSVLGAGMASFIDFFQARKVQSLSEAAGSGVDSKYKSCRLLAHVRILQTLSVAAEEVSMGLGAASGARELGKSGVFIRNANKPWKVLTQRKVFKEMRKDFADANQIAKGGVDLDHWFIPAKERWGKHVPDWIKNQPWNLKPQTMEFNRWDKYSMNSLKRTWLETPDWFKAAMTGWGSFDIDRLTDIAIEELEKKCKCEKQSGGK